MGEPRGERLSNPPVRLVGAHVVVVGAGGLGCSVLPRLARMGLGRLTIIDGDRVEAKNLPQQPLYEEMDIGHFKASTAAGWMRQLMPDGEVMAHDVFISSANVKDLFASATGVVEGVDDLHAKQLIDRACAELRIPLVSGGVHGDQGQVIVLHAPGQRSDLLREQLFSGRPGAEQDGCDMRDVPLPVLDEAGKRMAWRMRSILHGEPVPNGVIDVYQGTEWVTIAPPR
jgi:molybdopterin/thiamine biosynthesis adenylyltransferase